MNRLSGWIDHGLKNAHWPVSGATRASLLLVLGLLIAGTYLMQSSQIVTTSRHIETLRSELIDLRRSNSLLLVSISQTTSAKRMMERAVANGFKPAEIIEFVTVATSLQSDAPSLRDGYISP